MISKGFIFLILIILTMRPTEGITNEKRKRDGNSRVMHFEKQQKYRDRKNKEANKEDIIEMNQKKKKKDRLRYLLNKIAKDTISKSELGKLKNLREATCFSKSLKYNFSILFVFFNIDGVYRKDFIVFRYTKINAKLK